MIYLIRYLILYRTIFFHDTISRENNIRSLYQNSTKIVYTITTRHLELDLAFLIARYLNN